jgi:hypothetical protein
MKIVEWRKVSLSVRMVAVMLCFWGVILGGTAMAIDKVLYDDFSGKYLDPARWTPQESVIKVENGKLVNQLAAKPSDGTGSGQPVAFMNSATIHTIKTTVTLQEAIIRNEFTGSVSAGIFANYFQTADGSCMAMLQIIYNPDKSVVAGYGIADGANFQGDILANNLKLNTAYDLTVSHNETNNTFTFTIDGTSKSVAGPQKTGNIDNPFKNISVQINPNQLNKGVDGYVAATFEDVYVNGSLYDDFNTAPLNNTKWGNWETVRRIESGKLNLSVNNSGQMSRTTNSLILTENQPFHVEASVKVKSDSWLLNGATGMARINSVLYNDTYGAGSGKTYNGSEGNVSALVAIRVKADRTMYVQYYCERSDDATWSTYTTLFSGNFSTSVQFDTSAVLGLTFDAAQKKIIFHCNNEQVTYNILTPVYEANVPNRVLQSRVYANPGQSGYMFVDIDDVYISNDLSVTPTNRDVTRYAGTTTFDVANLGEETLPWTAKVISGDSWLRITSGASGTDSGTITCAYDPNLGFAKRTGTIRVTAAGIITKTRDVTVTQAGKAGPFKSNIWGVWPNGVYVWKQSTNTWSLIPSTAGIKMIAAGDVDGDGVDDLIGTWTSSGLWVRYSTTGKWSQLSKTSPNWITAGDLNNDGKDDAVASWTGDALYYRNSATGGWVKVGAPAMQMAVGDISGNGRDELLALWSTGVWVRSFAGVWQKLDSGIPKWLAAGDMTGDYRSDLVGSYATGTWYRDSVTTKWYSMSFAADQVTTGDINGDGLDDLVGVWPCGLYVRYGGTNVWQLITTSKPSWIATGKTATVAMSAGYFQTVEESAENNSGQYETGPGGVDGRFVFMNGSGPGGSE